MTSTPALTRDRSRVGAGLLAGALLLTLGACSGGDLLGGAGGAAESGSSVASSATGTGAGDRSSVDVGAAPVAVGTAESLRAVVRTGRLTLRAEDVGRARTDLLTGVEDLGGSVASETASADRRGRPRTVVLQVEVPTDRFEEAMDTLAAVARTTWRRSNADDVTEQVVDVDARVRTQAAAVRRMEQLLDEAGTVDEVVRVESELVRRLADLESLQSRQESLATRTATATVDVELRREARQVDRPGPVTAGLSEGWRSFVAATGLLVVTVAGVLPFLLAGLVVGGPLLWWRRRRGRTA